MLKTLEDLGIEARNALVVGDMPFDILMGKNAGAYTCAVTYGNADRKSLEEAGADYIIDEIGELSSLGMQYLFMERYSDCEVRRDK